MEGLMTLTEYILHMSWKVSFVIIAVLIGRWLLRKESKRWAYMLWLVVALRLLCPFRISSAISIFQWVDLKQFAQETVLEGQQDNADALAMQDKGKSGQQQIITADSEVKQGENQQSMTIVPETAVKTEQHRFIWVCVLWMLGVVFMLGYGMISYVRLGRKLRYATHLRDNIYECENFASPFVYGICHPAIYIPYRLTDSQQECVLQHERVHLKRKDHWIKMGAYLLLTLYWFHPLMWLAYYLMSVDMEMSCDERALQNKTDAQKAEYSNVLLAFARNQRTSFAGVVTFGQQFAKARIKRILQKQKRSIIGAGIAIIVTIFVILICVTDYNETGKNAGKNQSVGQQDMNLTDAKQLFDVKNPYIGDAAANEVVLTRIQKVVGAWGSYTQELQTEKEPYVLILHFQEMPKEDILWKGACLYLALTENAGEVRWDYPINTKEEDGEDKDYYTASVSLEDAKEEWNIKDIKEYGKSAEKLEELLELLETSNARVKSTEKAGEQIAVIPAQITEKSFVGADLPVVDYGDGNILIFHDYCGLFVYDVQAETMKATLDLEVLECHYTQGDYYTEVNVDVGNNKAGADAGGMQVYLHNISKDIQYCYSVEHNTLTKLPSQPGVQYPANDTVPKKGEILVGDGKVLNWNYKLGDKTYSLFKN